MLSKLFFIIGNLLILVTLVTYFKQVRDGESEPNPATWSLWLVIGLINLVTYFLVVEGSVWKSLYVILATAGLSVIFLYSFAKGRFQKLALTDKVCLVLAIAVCVVWKTTGSAVIANVSLQAAYIISFIPTIRALLMETAREKPLPWFLATFSYVFSIAGILSSQTYSWPELAYPVVNGILGNGFVAILALFQSRRAEASP